MNMDSLVTPAEIEARIPGLSRKAVCQWAVRGLIKRHGKRGRDPLYRWGDITRLEAQTRLNPKSTRHPARRNQRCQQVAVA